MKITIVAIGKKHDSKLLSSIADYTSRLSHYAQINWELVEAKVNSSMSESEIRSVESTALLSKIPLGSTLTLLDERGSELTSVELATKIQSYMNQSTKQLVFAIGGAYGVNEVLMKRANFIWSLSKLVFPHQLVRLLLAEQLYRAHTILAGEKYHHI